jgi:transcriptional regulator with XRE-family HTH domain
VSTSKTSSVGSVIGANLRQLRDRRSWTQDQVAKRVQVAGLPWTPDVVSDLEAGRREQVTVGELAALTWALGIDIASWFEGEGWMQISPHARVDRAGMRSLLHGQADAIFEVFEPLSVSLGPETHAAKRLGVDVFDVLQAADQLWGRRLDEERDRRLGATEAFAPEQLRARRGRVTRTLLEELKQALEGARSST